MYLSSEMSEVFGSSSEMFERLSIDLFSLGGLFSDRRPGDDTLENSCFQVFSRMYMNGNFKVDKKKSLENITWSTMAKAEEGKYLV